MIALKLSETLLRPLSGMPWWIALFIAIMAILSGFTQLVAKRAGSARNARAPGPQPTSRFNDTPYALFLSGLAALIGCVVAVPAAIIERNWIPMLAPAVFSGTAFLSAL